MTLYRVIATDYDGTLTATDHPAPTVLDAVDRARARGLRVVLITGRRLAPLLELVPDALDRFDAVVAENGAVLARAGGVHALTAPVAPRLAAALAARGVPLVRGQVLLATGTEHATTALDEIGRLGLDVQLVRNRGQLMLLPPGVTKGTGLYRALGELGISYHNTVAVGDAENDHALFDVSELAVAVANAVPSLAEHADVVLHGAAGDGLVELLDGPLLDGGVRALSRRLRITLGADDGGAPVTLPATPSNILVIGASGTGKSYVAGMIAERLVRLDYAVCVLDPEGDYQHLAELQRVAYVGGPAPSVDELAHLLGHRFGCVVFDTSQVAGDPRALLEGALYAVATERARSGCPHWLVVDEAHLLFGHERAPRELLVPEDGGLCLVTWRPEALADAVTDEVDVTITALDAATGRAAIDSRLIEPDHAVLTVAERDSAHVRHRRKYAHVRLPPALWFRFRADGRPTGRSAANLEELVAEVRAAGDATIDHHVAAGDFSRWVADVIRDDYLAEELRALERDARSPTARIAAREPIAAAVERRYLALA